MAVFTRDCARLSIAGRPRWGLMLVASRSRLWKASSPTAFPGDSSLPPPFPTAFHRPPPPFAALSLPFLNADTPSSNATQRHQMLRRSAASKSNSTSRPTHAAPHALHSRSSHSAQPCRALLRPPGHGEKALARRPVWQWSAGQCYRVAGAAGEHPPRRPPPSLSSDTESVRRAAADSAPPPAQAAFRRRQSWQTS